MALESLSPDIFTSLTSHHSGADWSLSSTDRSEMTTPDTQQSTAPNGLSSIITEHAVELLLAAPDSRLDYLRRANPALTDDHLRQIVRASMRHVKSMAKGRLSDKIGEATSLEMEDALETLAAHLVISAGRYGTLLMHSYSEEIQRGRSSTLNFSIRMILRNTA